MVFFPVQVTAWVWLNSAFCHSPLSSTWRRCSTAFHTSSNPMYSGGKVHKDILRFGFTPLYIGFEDVWNAVEHLRQVLESGEWQKPEFNQTHAVT